jgi:hypothetical protein
MDTLIFSQTAIFRLQQLESQYFRLSGVRHKLATEAGILALLSESAQASERKTRKSYDAFVMELNKRQIDALATRGINLRTPLQVVSVTPLRQAM